MVTSLQTVVMMYSEINETRYAKYSVENDIMHIIYTPNLIITLDVAKDIVSNRIKFSGGNRIALFFDIRGLASIDTASRKYFASPEAVDNVSAGAFWVESQFSKLAGNIFIKIDKPLVPTKLFTDNVKALLWLGRYK